MTNDLNGGSIQSGSSENTLQGFLDEISAELENNFDSDLIGVLKEHLLVLSPKPDAIKSVVDQLVSIATDRAAPKIESGESVGECEEGQDA